MREGLVIATKGGIVHGKPPNGSPAYLRQALEASLRRLRRDCIDLYQLHKPDSTLPFEDSVGALQSFRQEGKIRHVGLSNVSVAQIELACRLGPIVSVQNEYNLSQRKHQDVLEHCQRQGIVFLPFFPLRLGAYQTIVESLAQKHGVGSAQIALAWLRQRADVMVPIPGTLSSDHLASNLAAVELKLNADDIARLDTTA